MTHLNDADFARVVQDARERHNLSEIVGRHTALNKRGRNELVGLCCFHTEKTPSLEVNDAKGTYHCHGCGAGGDAITFLRKMEGMSFRQAIETLTGDAFPVVSEEERSRRKADDERIAAERVALARSIWAATVPPGGTAAEVYARSRGITIDLPPTVRFVMAPRWRNAETGEVGRDHPAMACALQNEEGEIVGVQCIFLQDGGRRKYERVRDDGTKAKAKLSYGVMAGSALRLGPVAERIVATEGPEDGLTLLQELAGQSVWVSCGTELLSRIGWPPEVKSVCFAGDNNAPGRKAVAAAGASLRARGVQVTTMFPDAGFKDWNDQLRGVRS